MDTQAKRPVKTAVRTFEILEAVRKHSGRTAEEVASELGLGKTTVRRYLLTLTEEEYLVREGKEFSIALKFIRFGCHARKQDAVFQLVKPKLEMIAEETGEAVWYQTAENGLGVRVYRVDGEQAIDTGLRPGTTFYLHQTSIGKAILAYLPQSRVLDIIDYYGLPTKTTDTINSRGRLFNELEAIRNQGYAINREETVKGLHAIGVPICDPDDEPLGGISVTGPANRLNGEFLKTELSNLLLGTTNEIELTLSTKL